MIAVSVMATTPLSLVLLLAFLLTPFAYRSHALSNCNPPPPGNAAFSAEDFDWRETVPYLFEASQQPGELGLQTVLENSKVLRTYVASEAWAECRPGNNRCDSSLAGFTLEGEVKRRIDGIVKESLRHEHKSTTVDYPFRSRFFPFTEISALRSDKLQDAYLVLLFADRTYYVTQLRAEYGEPYDTNIFDRFSVFMYRLNTPRYTSQAVFEVDPADGAVMKVAISLKARKRR
jgi:hypothetical protein